MKKVDGKMKNLTKTEKERIWKMVKRKICQREFFNTILWIGIGLVFFALLFIISEYHRTGIALKDENWRMELENRAYASKLEGCEKYNPFMAAATKIGKIAWTEEYDCLDHAKDFTKELEKADIDSFIAVNKDRSHAVTAVLVDYNGHFVSPNDNFEILEIRDKEMKIICE